MREVAEVVGEILSCEREKGTPGKKGSHTGSVAAEADRKRK